MRRISGRERKSRYASERYSRDEGEKEEKMTMMMLLWRTEGETPNHRRKERDAEAAPLSLSLSLCLSCCSLLLQLQWQQCLSVFVGNGSSSNNVVHQLRIGQNARNSTQQTAVLVRAGCVRLSVFVCVYVATFICMGVLRGQMFWIVKTLVFMATVSACVLCWLLCCRFAQSSVSVYLLDARSRFFIRRF